MTESEEIQKLKNRIKELEIANSYYEGDGVAKLFYGLNRKAGEMADLLNGTNLRTIDLADPKDKTFERLKVIWNDAASIATAVKTLGDNAGISGDEEKDIKTSKYKITTPESIADSISQNK